MDYSDDDLDLESTSDDVDVESMYDDDDGDDWSDIPGEDEVKGYVVEDDDGDFGQIGSSRVEKNFSVLKDSDIRACQEDDIRRVSTVLSLPRDTSCILLRHFNWSVSKVHEAWFSDEDRVKKAIGLVDDPVVWFHNDENLECGICFESFPLHGMKSAACGHPFCRTCWAGYMRASISDGPGCLSLRCPDPSCTAFVGQDMINYFASPEDKEKYSVFLCRSYIEDNKKTKWCPAPGCEYAVNFCGDDENYDVYCHCTNGFCWNCTEDAHRPVNCETVAKWTLKNSAESENTNWILVNSKPCPKCKRPIEKNQGCMHMTCIKPCGHSFCWLCLQDWDKHNTRTGGNFSCNGYTQAQTQGPIDEAERKRLVARSMLEKYTHHYERWASNQVSRDKALKDLEEMKNVKILQLAKVQCHTEIELRFLIEAWQQIVECRRVLKWTYAYGYYLPDDELPKKQFFEYLQGQAESALERLHQHAEKELEQFISATKPSKEFLLYREKLSRLTGVTRTYFENLVTALKHDLVDVEITKTSSTAKKAETSISVGIINDASWSAWACRSCTFHNLNIYAQCVACGLRR